MTTLEPSNLALFWVGVIAVAILVYVILDGFDLEVTATGARLANGTFIPAELIVWAAGVKSPDILTKLDGLETNRAGQLVVFHRYRPRATRTFLPSVTAPPTLGPVKRARPSLRVRKLRTSRPRIWHGN
jgi:hypothetical protein